MLRVTIEEAKPGMPLAMPVHHPENPGRVLLHAGAKLSDRAIERLVEQDVHEMWIAWPGLEFIREHANPQLDHSHRAFTKRLGTVFDDVADDVAADVEYGTLKSSISDFMDKLLESPRAAHFLSDMMGSGSPYVRHASAVCLMSLLMGLKLGGYLVRQRKRLAPKDAANIVNLGVGAMLHDIGMMHIPEDVAQRFFETGDETDPEWREHVFIGHRMVAGKVDATATATVLHHHQRYDGLGFPAVDGIEQIFGPEGREGEMIHVFPRIVAAADLFDRLRFGNRSKPVRTRVGALNTIRKPEYIGRIDPVVLQGLFAVTPPYPPGTVVTLNTGDRAVVTNWFPKDPCRPEVRLIGGLEKTPDDMTVGVTIDLRDAPRTHVAFAEGRHVLDDNYTLDEGDFAQAA